MFKNYAIVFQDVMLFDESVMENIRLGRGDATDEEVMAAARAAQCEEFIKRLPQGYQTNIGENGSALSGGERQRISIARALLKMRLLSCWMRQQLPWMPRAKRWCRTHYQYC